MNLEYSSNNSDHESLGRVASEAVELIRSAPPPEESLTGLLERAAAWPEAADRTAEDVRLRSLRRRLGLIMSAAAAIAIVALFLRAMSRAPVAPSGTDELSVSPPTVPLPHQWGGAGWLAARSRPPAPAGEAVAVGANIKTDAGQRRRVLLPDGSTLYVNANSEVKLDGERHLTLLAGEVFLEVAHRENCGAGNADMSVGDRQVGNLPHSKPDGATFVVHTPQRDVSALGTRFSVRADAEGTGVVVVQGKVQVGGLATPLQAGQELAPTGTGAGTGPARLSRA